MRWTTGLLLTFLLPIVAQAGNHWNVTLPGGGLRFQGVVVAEAPARWIRLNEGLTTLHFVAKYRATARQVTGGTANAQAWFALTYQ